MSELKDCMVLKAEWLVTRECNLRCEYCQIRNKPEGMSEISTERAIEIVEMFSKLWPGAPMVIYGGEPTTREDLPDILAAGVRFGVKLPVISNSIRVLHDSEYTKRLVDAGLANWSVSLDRLSGVPYYDRSSLIKSKNGLEALRMFRDTYGIRDLVACITITRYNIEHLPRMVEELTAEGIWAIMTPLQVGDETREYGRSSRLHQANQEQADRVGETIEAMAKSGGYLLHNDSEWFAQWGEIFVSNGWKCTGKAALTIDADGKIRYCVDHPLPEDIYAWEMTDPKRRSRYQELIDAGVPCTGCSWDQNVECLRRSRDSNVGVSEGRRRSRHEVPDDKLLKLKPAARKWFVNNPRLERVKV